MKKERSRPRGRPREFDRENALEKALVTFWSKGYSSTSLDDLTESMGINRPSLYASFGNKHDLFLSTIDHYSETIGARPLDAFLAESDIRKAVQAYFNITVLCVAAKNRPQGCLINNVAVEQSAIDPEVREKIAKTFSEKLKLITTHFEQAKSDGQLSSDSDSEMNARMIYSVMQAIATRARLGASQNDLKKLADSFSASLFP